MGLIFFTKDIRPEGLVHEVVEYPPWPKQLLSNSLMFNVEQKLLSANILANLLANFS